MAPKSRRKRKHIYDDAKTAPPLKRASIVLPYLPLDITINILAKLSTKSLLSCKRVCKTWHDIIEDPFFAQVHYDNTHVALIGIPLPLQNKSILMMESCYGLKKRFKLETLQMSKPFGTDLTMTIVNSCKGFLLIKSDDGLTNQPHGGGVLYMYNPLTKERMTLPDQRTDKPSQGKLVCGLAFSSTTKQYKVVSFLKQDGIYRKQVLTIGTWEWRRIHDGESILEKIRSENNNPVALNGSIHWLATGDKIARFDVDKEEFSFVASPCLIDPAKCVISVGILHGCLCVNIIDIGNSRHGVESWVMKQYAKADSWIQWCIVKNIKLTITPQLPNYKILECGDKEKIVVVTPSGPLLYYDLRLQQCIKKPRFHPIKGMQLHFWDFSLF